MKDIDNAINAYLSARKDFELARHEYGMADDRLQTATKDLTEAMRGVGYKVVVGGRFVFEDPLLGPLSIKEIDRAHNPI